MFCYDFIHALPYEILIYELKIIMTYHWLPQALARQSFQPYPLSPILLVAIQATINRPIPQFFISSPDPKGHVSYCYHWASVVSFLHFNQLL